MIPFVLFAIILGFCVATVVMAPNKKRKIIVALILNGLLLIVIAARGIAADAALVDATNGNGSMSNNIPELIALLVGLVCVGGSATIAFKNQKK